MSVSEMNQLETMWTEHREYLRRMLIGLSRDIDRAEDLLQETYLRARSGLATYRGGDSRAWLAAIAKNVFFGHARKSYVRSEVPIDGDLCETHSPVGSPTHIASLQVRDAVDQLTAPLRQALILRHYGGFSYGEIGERMDCPTGTARRRVWTAIRQLRSALGPVLEEAVTMRCEQVRGTRLLDYIYNALPPEQAKKIRAHLAGCPACREEERKLREIVTALDSASEEFQLTEIIDLDHSGMPTVYSWWSRINSSDQPFTETWWTINKDILLDYATIQDEEVTFDVRPCSSSQYMYYTKLLKPVPPGERINSLLVERRPGQDNRAKLTGDGTWHYHFGHTPNSAREWMLMLAVRLPEGAELINAEPAPIQTRTNGTTTLTWRSLLPKLDPGSDTRWQFECTVDYHLDAPEAPQDEPAEPSAWAKTHLKWAPEVAFTITDGAGHG